MTYQSCVAALAACAWLTLASACGGETAGESITLRWQAAGADDTAKTFTTDTGWQVTLDEAQLGLESISAIASEPQSRGAVAFLSDLLVPVARAHGGHDDANGRRVRAEWLDPVALDALAAEPRRLGNVIAEAGDIATIKLELARSADALPGSLHGFQAYVRGSAEKDGARVPFAGGVHLAADEPARRVETKVKFELFDGGALVVSVHPEEWLREAEFGRLPEADDGADREIPADSQVSRAMSIGVRSPDAFEVMYQPRKD
jgi:hypothetical protein